MAHVSRRTVDLTAYPDLIVMYLGMRVNAWTGVKTALGLGPQIAKSVAAKPDGLLLHEDFCSPCFLRMRACASTGAISKSLERWTRSEPHRLWWQNFLRDSGGTGFWHETYSIRGGMEAIYDDMAAPIGMMKFVPSATARGSVFSARKRLQREGFAGSGAGIRTLSGVERGVRPG